MSHSEAAGSRVWLECVGLPPGAGACSGPDGAPAAPSASQPRGESPSAPPEGREGGSSAFRRALTCEADSGGADGESGRQPPDWQLTAQEQRRPRGGSGQGSFSLTLHWRHFCAFERPLLQPSEALRLDTDVPPTVPPQGFKQTQPPSS